MFLSCVLSCVLSRVLSRVSRVFLVCFSCFFCVQRLSLVTPDLGPARGPSRGSLAQPQRSPALSSPAKPELKKKKTATAQRLEQQAKVARTHPHTGVRSHECGHAHAAESCVSLVFCVSAPCFFVFGHAWLIEHPHHPPRPPCPLSDSTSSGNKRPTCAPPPFAGRRRRPPRTCRVMMTAGDDDCPMMMIAW